MIVPQSAARVADPRISAQSDRKTVLRRSKWRFVVVYPRERLGSSAARGDAASLYSCTGISEEHQDTSNYTIQILRDSTVQVFVGPVPFLFLRDKWVIIDEKVKLNESGKENFDSDNRSLCLRQLSLAQCLSELEPRVMRTAASIRG